MRLFKSEGKRQPFWFFNEEAFNLTRNNNVLGAVDYSQEVLEYAHEKWMMKFVIVLAIMLQTLPASKTKAYRLNDIMNLHQKISLKA